MTGLDLNVFTNFSANRVEQLPICRTLRSFGTAFDFNSFSNIRVFCHAAPLNIPFDALHEALLQAVPGRIVELYSTRSLVDGYVRSLELSSAEMVFQLEHDYLFDANRIKHHVLDIAQAMRTAGIPYLRFNIGPNRDNELDRVSPVGMAGIPICKTLIFSNRPHLLDRAYALQNYVPRMNRAGRGSRGIEKKLTAAIGTGWIYGPFDYPPVIIHTDGHTALREWRRQHLSHRLLEFVSRNAKLLRDHFGIGHYGRIR
jgi:hypothetical protein